jgi:hypothetical protein
MFAGIATFVGGLFSSSKAQDTAIDAVRKLGGLDDMNSKEKAQFLLDYMAATKHQSPVRRLIAFALTALYSLVVLLWLVYSGVGYLSSFTPAMELAGATRAFLETVLVQPFNILLGFYFVTNIAQRMGK